MVGFSLYQSRKQYIERASVSTTNLSNSLAISIAGKLDKIDVALFAIARETRRQLGQGRIDPAALNRYLADQHRYLPELQEIWVTDADGNLSYGTLMPDRQINLGDREYFARVKNSSEDGLIISKPIFGRMTKTWSIPVCKRITHPDGSFAGVAFGSLRFVDFFSNMFSHIDVGKQGAITLLGDDLGVIVRYPSPTQVGGKLGDRHPAGKIMAAIRKAPALGSLTAISSFDGLERTVSYRRIPGSPFYLIVGESTQDYLPPWHKEAAIVLSLLLSFMVFTSAIAWVIKKRTQALFTLKLAKRRAEDLERMNGRLLREVDERERAQSALSEAKARLRSVIDSTSDLIWSVDSESLGLCSFNRSIQNYFAQSYGVELQIGMRPENIWPSRDFAQQWYELYQRALEEGGCRTEYFTFNGRLILDLTLNLLKSDGAVFGISVFAKDITASKRDEEEKLNLKAQLYQSQKMESIGRLAGGIAHDFNNMLFVIIGNAELAKFGLPEDDPLRENIEQIVKAAQRSSQITRQLLGFSRKQVINPQPVNLNLLILESEKSLGRLIGEDVKLTFKCGCDLGTVLIDPAQMEQILMNLWVNARDAMPEGGCLTVETSNVRISEEYSKRQIDAAPGEYVLLTISDTGCGMDRETRENIFEPFFTTKGVGKGTGLGLSTVYGIVTQNNGIINCYSEPGQGTVFKIYLPRIHQEVVPEEETASRPPSGSGRILLAEDEEMLRWTASRMLEELGYSVIQAATPQQAIALCREGEDFDLILTDVVMPGMNGRQMVECIRELRPEVRVLFMSGYTSDMVRGGMLGEGMNLVEKPLDIGQLSDKIRQMLL